jgi:three-Cys-motif partner protein
MKLKKSSSRTPELDEPAPPLFPDLAPSGDTKLRRYKRIQTPIWSEHKAKFIQQYLRIFVQITKHGAYIDGFAGPQNEGQPDAWTAELVLKSDPKWLRHFFLCEKNRKSLTALRKLRKSQPERDEEGKKIYRNIEIWPGDFNRNVAQILKEDKITQKEATFCLLDQRMFECHWETVKKLAAYKKPPVNKIEILYFLGVGWLHRSISGIRHPDKMDKWWGRSDWRQLRDLKHIEIVDLVRRRFENDLGYRFVASYPIYDREKGNRVMYYMIHASDHEEAPTLMVRAHRKAVRSLPKEIQELIKFPQEGDGCC